MFVKKHSFLKFFALCLKESEIGDVCMFKGQLKKLPFKYLGNWAFSSFSSIILLVPP